MTTVFLFKRRDIKDPRRGLGYTDTSGCDELSQVTGFIGRIPEYKSSSRAPP